MSRICFKSAGIKRLSNVKCCVISVSICHIFLQIQTIVLDFRAGLTLNNDIDLHKMLYFSSLPKSAFIYSVKGDLTHRESRDFPCSLNSGRISKSHLSASVRKTPCTGWPKVKNVVANSCWLVPCLISWAQDFSLPISHQAGADRFNLARQIGIKGNWRVKEIQILQI